LALPRIEDEEMFQPSMLVIVKKIQLPQDVIYVSGQVGRSKPASTRLGCALQCPIQFSIG
jgi:hypothetical protein